MTFDQNLIQEFQDHLGYTFLNFDNLSRVLTTVSFSNENQNVNHNEALATLGDAVAKLIITQHAIQVLKMNDKGTITQFKENYESREAMTKSYFRYFDNESHEKIVLGLLQLGKGERQNMQYKDNNFFGEFLEALFGAIFLDTFSDLVRTGVMVKRLLNIK